MICCVLVSVPLQLAMATEINWGLGFVFLLYFWRCGVAEIELTRQHIETMADGREQWVCVAMAAMP